MNKPQIDVGFHPPRRASPLSLSNDNNSLGFRRLASSMDLGPRERRRGGEGGEGREDGALLGFGVAGLGGSGEGGRREIQSGGKSHRHFLSNNSGGLDCGKIPDRVSFKSHHKKGSHLQKGSFQILVVVRLG